MAIVTQKWKITQLGRLKVIYKLKIRFGTVNREGLMKLIDVYLWLIYAAMDLKSACWVVYSSYIWKRHMRKATTGMVFGAYSWLFCV